MKEKKFKVWYTVLDLNTNETIELMSVLTSLELSDLKQTSQTHEVIAISRVIPINR